MCQLNLLGFGACSPLTVLMFFFVFLILMYLAVSAISQFIFFKQFRLDFNKLLVRKDKNANVKKEKPCGINNSLIWMLFSALMLALLFLIGYVVLSGI